MTKIILIICLFLVSHFSFAVEKKSIPHSGFSSLQIHNQLKLTAPTESLLVVYYRYPRIRNLFLPVTSTR